MTSTPILLAFLLTFPASAALSPETVTPETAAAAYVRLQSWQFGETVPVPAEGLTIRRDTATWTLQSGSIRLMQPGPDGVVTGLVFEGSGRFEMTFPDRFELAQLRRFSARKSLDSIDQPFTQLVLRTSDPAIIRDFPAPATERWAADSTATKRHAHWLTQYFLDNDARIVAALLNPGATVLTIDARTEDFDWLTWDYDSVRPEEITLTRFHHGAAEHWISLDRVEDRRPDGRPGEPLSTAPVELSHVDVRADLTKTGRSGEVGRHNQRALDGRYEVTETFIAQAAGVSALRLELSSFARKLSAFTEAGVPLGVLRDHIGGRSVMLDNKAWDNDFVVILDEPLRKGEKRVIRFTYELETANYAAGDTWYPTVPAAFGRKYTGRLELKVRPRNEARSMGRLESRTEEKESETTIWVIDKPVKMLTFSTATRFEEVKLEVDGIPPVISFGPSFQIDNRDKVRNVGVDVANSMQFFQNMFEDRIEAGQFYVTSIAGNHGQAFDGFLHMGEFTYSTDSPGASELFRAHEVAHEWWGHKIGWSSYRDQWLSEAFAEYSAMMFVQGFVKGGDRYFDEILRSYDGIVKGNLSGGFSKFNRPWLIEFNPRMRERVGPIGHGYRASTSDMPAGYVIQTYHKAPLVLHMLRMTLLYKTLNDDLFIRILRDFVHSYSGSQASTADFQKVVERHVGGDWSFFFDAWIYGSDIPSYSWSYDVKPAENGIQLTINLRRSDVTGPFKTIIPVSAEFDGGKVAYFFIVNDRDEQSTTVALPSKPKKVVFAPGHSLLAAIRRE